MAFVNDDRDPDEVVTHTNLIGGRDTFLSGWGRADGANSFAYWACEAKDVGRVTAWVSGRSDFDGAAPRCASDVYAPEDQIHIYVVRDGHPSIGGL